MDVFSLIAQTHTKLLRNILIVSFLRFLVGISVIAVAGALVALVNPTAAIFLVVTLAIVLLLAIYRQFFRSRPTIADAALALDAHAGSKERFVSVLSLKESADSDERKQLLVRQLADRSERIAPESICPLVIPSRLKKSLLLIPVACFATGWLLAPRYFYTVYTDPMAQEIQDLIAAEEPFLSEPVKESLEQLADAIEAGESGSDQVLAALASAEAEVNEALSELASESSDNELVVEANHSFESESEPGEPREQKDGVSPIEDEATPTPTAIPESPDQPEESNKQPTPTPEPEKPEQGASKQEESSSEQSEVSDNQEGDGDGGGSKGAGGEQSGEGQNEQDSAGQEPSQESSSQSGQGKGSSKSDDKNTTGDQSDQREKPSNDGESKAKTQPGKQESQSGGQKGDTSADGKPSESGEQKEGEGGQGAENQQSGAEQSISKVKDKLDDLKSKLNKGSGSDSKDSEKAQRDIEPQQTNDSEKQADKTDDENAAEEGKASGGGQEKSSGEKPEKSDARDKESSQTPPEFSDAAQGQSGASVQAESEAQKEAAEGEGFGPGQIPEFEEVHIPGTDEKFDTRFTGKDIQRSAGTGGEKYRVELEDIELARPEVRDGTAEQRIPPEYQNVLE